MWRLAVLELERGGGSAFKEHRNVSRGGGGCEGKECAVRDLRGWKLRWG